MKKMFLVIITIIAVSIISLPAHAELPPNLKAEISVAVKKCIEIFDSKPTCALKFRTMYIASISDQMSDVILAAIGSVVLEHYLNCNPCDPSGNGRGGEAMLILQTRAEREKMKNRFSTPEQQQLFDTIISETTAYIKENRIGCW